MIKRLTSVFPVLALSLLLVSGCGDKQSPPNPPTNLGSTAGSLTPITPLDDGSGGMNTFNPDDQFDPGLIDGGTNPPAPPPDETPPLPDGNGLAPVVAPASGEPSTEPSELPPTEGGSGVTPVTPSPTPSTSESSTPTPTPSTGESSVAPTPTPTPTPAPTATPTPTPTPTPTATPTPTPTPTPNPYGNASLGALVSGSLVNPQGLDVKSGKIYVTHFFDGTWPTPNKRIVKGFDPSGNSIMNDLTVFSTGSGTEPVLSGVAVDGAIIWSVRRTQDSDGTNLYKHNTSGQFMNQYKAGNTNAIIEDVAVDTTSHVVYLADPTDHTIIKFDELNPNNSQLYFSGSANIDPVGLAVDTSGNVYATNSSTGKVVKFDSSGTKLLEFDGKGTNGSGSLFAAIGDLAIDPRNGDIYVIAMSQGAVQIYRYDSQGNFKHTFAKGDLSDPEGIGIGNDGTIYVADKTHKSVLMFGAGTTP